MKKILIFLLMILCISSSYAALDVFVQDQTTPTTDLWFVRAIGIPTVLNQSVDIDQNWIIVNDPSSFSVGTYVGITVGAPENRFYFADAIAINGNNITLAAPLDYNFSNGANVIPLSRDLNVDGSVTPVVFELQGAGCPSNFTIDITRIIPQIHSSSVPDYTKFGGISGGLQKGVVLQMVNGIHRNIAIWTTNGEMANVAYDLTTLLAANPGQGVNGLTVRYTFAGADKHGVAVRLACGEALRLIIQDDLTTEPYFRVSAAIHEVDDTVRDSVEIEHSEGFEMLVNITIILILLTIGIGFAWFSHKSENYIWYIFGAIWFFAAAPFAVSVLSEIDSTFRFLTIAFFWLISFVLVYEALETSVKNSSNKDD